MDLRKMVTLARRLCVVQGNQVLNKNEVVHLFLHEAREILCDAVVRPVCGPLRAQMPEKWTNDCTAPAERQALQQDKHSNVLVLSKIFAQVCRRRSW